MAKLDFGTNIITEEESASQYTSHIYNPLGVARTYGVVLVFEDEVQKKLQIHFEIDVFCINKTDDDYFEIEIFKHQIYINEKKPDILIDELSERCGKVIYPLNLKVNKQAKVLNIVNQHTIIERWEREKENIKQLYNSKEVSLLVNNMDSIIYDKKKLTDLILQRDWFITLFFSPIYTSSVKSKTRKELKFPIIPYAPGVSYEIENEIIEHPNKKGDIIFNQKGLCIDHRSEKDILRGNQISFEKTKRPVKGEIAIKHQLYKNSLLIDAITGVCNLNFPSGKSKKISIEIYNLKNKTPQSSTQKKAAIEKTKEENEKSLPKKKKKFSFFFGK